MPSWLGKKDAPAELVRQLETDLAAIPDRRATLVAQRDGVDLFAENYDQQMDDIAARLAQLDREEQRTRLALPKAREALAQQLAREAEEDAKRAREARAKRVEKSIAKRTEIIADIDRSIKTLAYRCNDLAKVDNELGLDPADLVVTELQRIGVISRGSNAFGTPYAPPALRVPRAPLRWRPNWESRAQAEKRQREEQADIDARHAALHAWNLQEAKQVRPIREAAAMQAQDLRDRLDGKIEHEPEPEPIEEAKPEPRPLPPPSKWEGIVKRNTWPDPRTGMVGWEPVPGMNDPALLRERGLLPPEPQAGTPEIQVTNTPAKLPSNEPPQHTALSPIKLTAEQIMANIVPQKTSVTLQPGERFK
jgi:hypothetical protein